MLASTRPNQGKRGRRGIILVLVLGILALMAIIGVTFATFSGQSRISARNFAQSVIQPQRDELMDYALAQLISDTADIRSAIRGHSLARDMYGNDTYLDASGNSHPLVGGYLASRPDGAYVAPHNDPYFYVTAVAPVTGSPTFFDLTTNITVGDSTFYGYDFTRWTLRVSYTGARATSVPPIPPYTGLVSQSLEVLLDNGPTATAGVPRVFRVNINPTDQTPTLLNPTVPNSLGNTSGYNTQLPGYYLVQAASNGTNLVATAPFILDGRWLHAFNGPGMTTNAVHANFRYNGLSPNAVGMDEDYDAVDLENWFLAMQSADGQVIIPSFHRPAAIRQQYNANGTVVVDDWKRLADTTQPPLANWSWADSASRILRPVAADGHDPNTFPDLTPGPNGQITYDVDNDGDGQTDSVWVDLGYPARRNAQGQLYKPLFAFMVIGLNGRIPLNTAGNLAGGRSSNSATHAAHLGNSVSEVDPTYGLQNGFVTGLPGPPSLDDLYAFTPPDLRGTANPVNGQVDNSNTTAHPALDVRLTQLRNLLAGTRPQPNPTASVPPWVSDPTGQINGDDNFVMFNGSPYFMPNGIADLADVDGYGASPPSGVIRSTPSVAGRWGEAQAVPGYPYAGLPNPNPPPPYLNLVTSNYNNHIRAGFSLDMSDYNNGTPRDAADDNYNSFDPYPPATPTYNRQGEVKDLDFLDPAGAFLLPVERMRRFLAPADINGTGRVLQWNGTSGWTYSTPNYSDVGNDQWGRVVNYSYFRPPGLPGQVSLSGGGDSFPWASGSPYPSNIVTPNVANNNSHNNNPLHGFESFRFPNLAYGGTFTPQRMGGVPVDQPSPPPPGLPSTMPTYDVHVNGLPSTNSDGLNEADEMNLYVPNAQLDSPFGFSDLEWLYRLQDVDGASLTSRLAQLAPISFTNTVDGQRRRRLYALDTWDLNAYSWTNDNPLMLNPNPPPAYVNSFPNNRSFTFNVNPPPYPQNASFLQLGLNQLPPNPLLPTPPLAHRDKKINLNYPLPVSNDPNEAVRQKWISDTYQTLKLILPPLAVDTPEELAQLSQFVINIVDFRDPDATMTHWRNPDVTMAVWNGSGPAALAPVLIPSGAAPPKYMAVASTATPPVLDQHGMEFNPIAINEVLAYSFLRKATGPLGTATPRFFIELVNTLTAPETGTYSSASANNASILDLSGLLSNGSTVTAPQTPWNNACWDIIFTDDRANNRPDPYLGQLQPPAPAVLGTNKYGVYGLVPLTQDALVPVTPPSDVTAFPLPQTPQTTANNPPLPLGVPFGQYYFTVIGNNILDFPSSVGNTESSPLALAPPTGFTIAQPWDPVDYNVAASPLPSMATLPAGALPLPTNGTVNTTYPSTLQTGNPPTRAPLASGAGQFFWVCLRRPANPFAQVSATNPMIVVDSMRFPYIEGGGTVNATTGAPTIGPNYLYSYQRLQPYRGGQAVPVAPGSGTGIDTRYGYTEQIAGTLGGSNSGNYGNFGSGGAITQNLLHTLGLPNDVAFLNARANYPGPPLPVQQEQWDYFPFNDRDFTSVAELTLVPGCPPGLFTKQFAEFSPTYQNVTTYFTPAATSNLTTPPIGGKLPTTASGTATDVFPAPTPPTPVTPHTFPYLVDKFFYSGYGGPVGPTAPPADPGSVVGGYGADGWFKMFEFFEVPSQMIGAIGPVAQGTNFDWLRQDTKPGLINLNLIIDEEVFFSVFGKQDGSFNQQLMNFAQLPISAFTGASWIPAGSTSPLPLASTYPPVPLVVTATNAYGAPAAAYPMHNVGVVAPDPLSGGAIGNRMKAAFAQFLWLRHGGSGFVFGYGSGLPGQNTAVLTSPANPNAWPAPLTPATSPIPADRPFHSLSYPDINYTIMRPAALPPSQYTDPQPLAPTTLPIPNPFSSTPYIGTSGTATAYTYDPGVRNPNLYQSVATGTPPVSSTTSTPPTFVPPPAIPLRRLFQPPDFTATGATTASNASSSGDLPAYLNNFTPAPGPTAPPTATGALPVATTVNDGFVNLFWTAAKLPTTTPLTPNPYLGSGPVSGTPTPIPIDNRQHPHWRSELLQKAMNLTTVRTHQYAVWITIGFFEVTRQGDLLMASSATPWLAFDILGPEIGASTGQTTRYRGFFLVDRLQLTGYDPNVIGSFRPAVVYRQTIE